MRISKKLFCLLIIVLSAVACSDANLSKGDYEASVEYSIVDGVIILEEPERQAGQQSMLEFRAEPLDTVRVGFVGLGMRGPGAVERFTYIDGVRQIFGARRALADISRQSGYATC